MIVRSQKSLTDDFVKSMPATDAHFAAAAQVPKRVAIFGVHGISPIQRYAFQDQVASALQSYLNAGEQRMASTLTWQRVVHWPALTKDAQTSAETAFPSAMRIYRSDDDAQAPSGRIYDVYEGYWSPLSKGKTTIVSAVSWLLNATFLGTSSTASIPCAREKLFSDLRYVGALLGIAGFALLLAVLSGLGAWFELVRSIPNAPSFFDLLANPLGTAFKLPLVAYFELIVDVALVYVLAQIVNVDRVGRQRDDRSVELLKDSAEHKTFGKRVLGARAFHRGILWVLWIVLAMLALVAVALAGATSGFAFALTMQFFGYAMAVVVCVGLLQCARALADFAVENVLGDVQVYTTHDCNSAFYAVRQQIIVTVASALRGVLSAVNDSSAAEPAPAYDAIHIFGHSLGSTIAMDVLIALRELIQQGSIVAKQWTRIRSLTTFGTALEKTRFFFDVRQPTLNAAQDQWENDVYGSFFSDGQAVLAQPDNTNGIFWSNFWYFHDIVANEIVSYKSDVRAGTGFAWTPASHPICANHLLANDRPWIAWIHSDYLSDPNFWNAAGLVVTS